MRCFSVAYIPMGIDCISDQKNENAVCEYIQLIECAASAMKPYLPHTLFFRFDPPLAHSDSFPKKDLKAVCKSGKVKKAFSDIQPPDTVLLDITKTAEELLAQMKPKWRYNIHLAEKKGVQVTRCGAEAIPVFYELYEETSKRDGIALHKESYYRDLFECASSFAENAESFSKKPTVSLYVARFEDMPIAAIITLFTEYEAVYLYGASSNHHRNVMPAYLLQWKAIQDAQAHRCEVYDFYGIPPTDDEHHPMYGLYRFKTGFGGEIVHRVGSIDVPLSPLYVPYVAAEKLRLFWFKKVKFLRKE